MRPSGIGGQAVLEGIMMKNKEKYSVAVRKPDGQIEVHTEVYKGIAADKPWAKLPLIRGMVNFIDSLILGMESLSYSASFYEDEEQDQEPGRLEKLLTDVFKEKAEKVVMGCTVAFSIFMAVAIFMVLPYVISGFFRKYIVSNTLLAIVEGVIRLGLFTLYVVLISCMKDIKRTYMYHGAEHKCINCIEHGLPLTVENVRKSSKEHKRCGTSFMLFVMIVGIVLLFFVRVESPLMRVIVRIALLPVIAGISYELIKWAGSSENPIVCILSKPGLWLQGLTTKEPDDEMIEVGIASVEAVFDWKAYLRENFGYKEEE